MIKLAGRVDDLESSQTILLDSQAKELAAAGRPVINLTAGELDSETPEAVLRTAEHAVRGQHNHYSPSQGLEQVRRAAQTYYKTQYGVDYATDQIIITNGAKQALYSVIQTLVNPGDEVLVPMPGWVSYTQQIRLADGVSVAVETDEQFMITQEALEIAVTDQTAGIIINSPNNPTGAVLTEDQFTMIAAFAEKNNLWVVSDEIYDRLVFDAVTPHSMAEYYPDGTVVVNGVSKSGAMTGWRVGCAAGPHNVIQAMNKLQSHLAGNVSNIAQLAAETAFGLDKADLQPTLDELSRRRSLVAEWVAQQPQLELVIPQGAFYCFIDISSVTADSEEFCKGLLSEQNVALVPGKFFGRDGFVRLSFANNYDLINEALERIHVYIAKGV